MSVTLTSSRVPSAAPFASQGDVLQSLAELRSALGDLRGGPTLTVVENLSGALDQIVNEHQGMAEELLNTYEQLGIVFEITRKLAGVQSESQVIALFLQSLRRSFEGRRVLVAERSNGDGWLIEGLHGTTGGWLNERIRRACERRSVVVEDVAAGSMPLDAAEVMVSAVHSGDALVCVLLLAREANAPAFKASEMLLVESLTTFCGDLIRSHRLVRELREMSISMVRSLVSAVDQKDEYTCGHSLRVAYYATELGKKLELADLELQMLQWSALLHDVGKIGIRDSVLKKEGKLTEDEFAHIKEHPVRSHKVVQEVPQLARALDGILHHHERYDGTGYPSGLKGEDIPLQARVIQIADVFDALTSNRSYRRAFSWEKALSIMTEEAGKTVDPRLAKIFEGYIRVELGDDPAAWDQLVERAGRPAALLEEPCGEVGGTVS